MPSWAITREGDVLRVFLPALTPTEWDPLLDAVRAAVAGVDGHGIAVIELRDLVGGEASSTVRTSMIDSLSATLGQDGVAVRRITPS